MLRNVVCSIEYLRQTNIDVTLLAKISSYSRCSGLKSYPGDRPSWQRFSVGVRGRTENYALTA